MAELFNYHHSGLESWCKSLSSIKTLNSSTTKNANALQKFKQGPQIPTPSSDKQSKQAKITMRPGKTRIREKALRNESLTETMSGTQRSAYVSGKWTSFLPFIQLQGCESLRRCIPLKPLRLSQSTSP